MKFKYKKIYIFIMFLVLLTGVLYLKVAFTSNVTISYILAYSYITIIGLVSLLTIIC